MKNCIFFLILFCIEKANSQTKNICSGDAIPSGWIKILEQSCNGCCEYNVPQIIIKKR